MELSQFISGNSSVLDVGCGSDSPLKYIKKRPYCVGVDGFTPSIERSRKQNIHNKYIEMKIEDISKKFKKKSYDCILASDVIEHFTKRDGNKLLSKMEDIARKKVIIFTPNGFVPQGEHEDNPWQVHRSGWTPKEMRKRGYKVIGIHGLRTLRGSFAEIKYKPKIIWRFISDITQIYTKKNPESAFAMLCIRDISR